MTRGRRPSATAARAPLLVALPSLLTLASLTISSAPASAQGRRGPDRDVAPALWLDARGGTAFTMGDLADFAERGGAWGVGAARAISARVRVRADLAAAYLPGTDWDNLKSLPGGGIVRSDAPDKGPAVDLTHLIGAVELRANESGSDWAILAHAGAGVTFLSAEATLVTDGGDFRPFTVNGGVTLAWRAAPRVRLVGRGELYLMLSRDAGPSWLGKELTMPFTAGVSVGL